jgi:hypothetical protein
MYNQLEQINKSFRELHVVRRRVEEDIEQCKLCLEREEPNVTMALGFLRRIEKEIKGEK